MQMRALALIAGIATMAGPILVRPTAAQVSDILTYRYDNARSGVNLQETILNKSNVKSGHFGKLAFRNVDGNIYAQPLIVFQAGILNRQSPVNVVIVATEHNSVYAFDADDVSSDPEPFAVSKKALWQRGLGPTIQSDGMNFLINGKSIAPGCGDLTTEIGITGTPVIKLTKHAPPKQGVIYAVAKSFSGTNVTYTLFELNLADGTTIGNPVRIKGGASGPNGMITFDPIIQLNRPALLLDSNDVLYVAFGGHCDEGDYRGWVLAYDVSDPSGPKQKPLDVWSTTFTRRSGGMSDKSGRGGIWMSGYGLATDGNNIYFSTGDGTYDIPSDSAFRELSDTVVKARFASGKFDVQDWFAPQNTTEHPDIQNELKTFDVDLGSAGPVLVPKSHLLIAAGKEGRMYLIDRDDMGKGKKASVQSFQVTRPSVAVVNQPKMAGDITYWNIHGAPVIWPLEGQMLVYVMGEEDSLKQFRLVPDSASGGWKFDPPSFLKKSNETVGLPPSNIQNDPKRKVFMPGGFLTISANGTDPGTGIVWATMPYAQNANMDVVRGVLRAFDASDVSQGELWDSEVSGNDGLGFFAKYNPPVVANGKVYVAAFQQERDDNGHHYKADGGLLSALVIYGPK